MSHFDLNSFAGEQAGIARDETFKCVCFWLQRVLSHHLNMPRQEKKLLSRTGDKGELEKDDSESAAQCSDSFVEKSHFEVTKPSINSDRQFCK